MCNWCEGEKRRFWAHDPDGEGVNIYIKPESKEIFIHSNELCSDIEASIPINFCPMCGRSFKEANHE